MPTQQAEIDFQPPPPTNPGRLEAPFLAFHEKNPQVYAKFCQCCDELIAAGFKSYSADAVCHAIRFAHDIAIQSTGDVDSDGRALKLNNNHVAMYARKWLAEHPDHPDFFHIRQHPNG